MIRRGVFAAGICAFVVTGSALATAPGASAHQRQPAVVVRANAPRQDLMIPGSGRAQAALATALAQVGKRYRWGGTGPGSFDCSGLTRFALAAVGVSEEHSALSQRHSGPSVARGDLQPGDLVFFGNPVSHVGMYVGDGQMVHAPGAGRSVRVDPVDQAGYAGAVRPGL
ncbi:MAG: hypothetical protein NVS1B16_10680 [Pseudarthrobacter sp.]